MSSRKWMRRRTWTQWPKNGKPILDLGVTNEKRYETFLKLSWVCAVAGWTHFVACPILKQYVLERHDDGTIAALDIRVNLSSFCFMFYDTCSHDNTTRDVLGGNGGRCTPSILFPADSLHRAEFLIFCSIWTFTLDILIPEVGAFVDMDTYFSSGKSSEVFDVGACFQSRERTLFLRLTGGLYGLDGLNSGRLRPLYCF